MKPNIPSSTAAESSQQLPLFARIKTEWVALFALGTPILIGQLAQISNGVIDTIMAGRSSADDLTGVAIGNSLWVPIFLFMLGLLNATQPLISGHKGSKQFDKILPVTWNALYICAAASVFASLILLNIDPVFSLLDMSENTTRIASGYLHAFAIGIPATLALITLRGLTDGLGFTKIYMAFSILATLINAPLNYIFIFGKLGLPAMGGIGCGWATAISQWLAVILLWTYMHWAPSFKDFHLWQQRMWPTRKGVVEILQLGVPIGFTIFVEATMFAVIAMLLAPLGAVVVAGHQIALNVVSVFFMVPLSVGLALTIRISYLVGAKDEDEAWLSARSTIGLVVAIAAVFASLLFVFAQQIASIYSTETEVIEMAAHLLWFGAVFQIADVLQVVIISALRGYKDTKVPMFIMVSSFWAVGIPLGYILAYKDWLVEPIGAAGFWIGMIAGLSHAAVWLFIRMFWFHAKRKVQLNAA